MNAASHGLKFCLDVYWLKWKTIAESGLFNVPMIGVGIKQFSNPSQSAAQTDNVQDSPNMQLRECDFPAPWRPHKNTENGLFMLRNSLGSPEPFPETVSPMSP